MLHRLFLSMLGLITFGGLASSAAAEDAFYAIPLDKLTITQGKIPQQTDTPYHDWRFMNQARPYVRLDVSGEACFIPGTPWEMAANRDQPSRAFNMLAVRAQAGREITGRLFLPKGNPAGMAIVHFKIDPATADPKSRETFFLIKAQHYQRLQRANLPGTAWYRHQADEARKQAGKAGEELSTAQRETWQRDFEMDSTLDLFSGTRALSENLQLDRALMLPTTPREQVVSLDTLEGISIAAMDFKTLIKDLKPRLDPLATCIPADQHAVFFPSFAAMNSVMHESGQGLISLPSTLTSRSQDMMIKQRYERQLCLPATELSRVLGPVTIDSVAVTGSDPYLSAGTDVAVLFEPKNATVLKTLLQARQTLEQQTNPQAKVVQGEVDGVAYSGLRSPDRSVCSYIAQVGKAIVVTNSLEQLRRIVAVQRGAEALAALPEYVYFRNRYPLGDAGESALLMLSDAAIRRWCSARWRIGDSRRVRAAAQLSDLRARNADEMMKSGAGVNAADELAAYGSLAFLTPIVELPIDKVSQIEADSYKRWRDSYQQNWRNYFDPIAVRLSVQPKKLAADVSVIPLIGDTDLKQMAEIATGVKLTASSGDPHDALAHAVIAVNTKSEAFEKLNKMTSSVIAGIKIKPLSWVGTSAAVYADEDPFWQDLARAPEAWKFMEKNFHRLPIAIRVEVADSMKLVLFLTALRGYIDQSAPGMTQWETLNHNGQAYVKISPSDEMRKNNREMFEQLAIYYAATGDALVLTLNEGLLKRSIDRQVERKKAEQEGKALPLAGKPWLGDSLGLQVRQGFLGAMGGMWGESYQQQMQEHAWANIPILNEWKQRYPNEDPMKVHQRLWHARLLCPGGGKYVWNEPFQTMESTVYGHPGAPRKGPLGPAMLEQLRAGEFGVTFQDGGLRARVIIERENQP